MLRRTKIVATLGPATDDPKVLDEVLRAGVDVVRLNMSHGSHDDHERRADWVRNRARASGRQVGVLIDLQGPKIRCGRFVDGKIELNPDDRFVLDTDWDVVERHQNASASPIPPCTWRSLRGDTLLLNDGLIVLWVDEVQGSEVRCKVVVGGIPSNNKGINKLGGGLSAPALTDKDKEDIEFAARIGEADHGVFVRSAEDVHYARQSCCEAGGQGHRVEDRAGRGAGLHRGDHRCIRRHHGRARRSGCGDRRCRPPAAQKRLISTARSMNCVVITATQMMESMIVNPIPTRAEVFDVANAVIDGTDAVMLSAESAAGKYPAKAVECYGQGCKGRPRNGRRRVVRTTACIPCSAVSMRPSRCPRCTPRTTRRGGDRRTDRIGSTQMDVAYFIGYSDLRLTGQVATRRKVTIYRGVYPVSFDLEPGIDSRQANTEVIEELQRRGAVRDDDLVIITKGDLNGVSGGTNDEDRARW